MKQRLDSKIAAGDLGCYDGPPIGMTQEDRRAKVRAIRGSRRLASTINFLGLRP
jgi:hypothetical protein